MFYIWAQLRAAEKILDHRGLAWRILFSGTGVSGFSPYFLFSDYNKHKYLLLSLINKLNAARLFPDT